MDSEHWTRRRKRRVLRSTTVYLTDAQDKALRLLSDKTGIPVAEYIRRGIDMVLDSNKESR